MSNYNQYLLRVSNKIFFTRPSASPFAVSARLSPSFERGELGRAFLAVCLCGSARWSLSCRSNPKASGAVRRKKSARAAEFVLLRGHRDITRVTLAGGSRSESRPARLFVHRASERARARAPPSIAPCSIVSNEAVRSLFFSSLFYRRLSGSIRLSLSLSAVRFLSRPIVATR